KDRAGQPAIDEQFDARGNLLELQPGQALQWNGRNQLTQVIQVARIDGADDIERYVYDSEGARLRKYREVTAKSIVHTPEVRYLPGIELHVNSATGERLQVISVQAGRCSVRLLHWDSPPPAGLDNDQWRYCFDDHLGSSAFEVDAQAKTVSQEVYYPFGGTAWLAGRHEVETSYKTIRYSGKERDTTGLYYYGARYYAPWLQRWLNPDPAGDVDGLNFYRFVRNDPIDFVDKKGWISILARISDYLLERNLEDGAVVEHRGLNKIRKNSPELANKITVAVHSAIERLEIVVESFESHDYDMGLIKSYFGGVSPEGVAHLVEGYKGLLADAKSLASKPSKIVSFFDVRGNRLLSAFMFPNDRRKKIYINSDIFLAESRQNNTHAVIHELSHGSNIFMSEDLWYLNQNLDGVAGRLSDVCEMQDLIMESTSKNMMEGEFVENVHIHPSLNNNFMMAVESADMNDALNKFKSNPALRTHMALNNADTLAAFTGALARARQKQTAGF
ncbi:hypothetical protein KW846_29595, partial [Pseudomonas sp. PDM32]|uniref:RHS repeat-associated core domain-containing protein n=1 Tax=Pseudomonas sp. PDM32 TaxID=2854768 RepID=UPI002737E1F7